MHQTLPDSTLAPAMRSAVSAATALTAVRLRLENLGAIIELGHLDRLSAGETDLLVLQERQVR